MKLLALLAEYAKLKFRWTEKEAHTISHGIGNQYHLEKCTEVCTVCWCYTEANTFLTLSELFRHCETPCRILLRIFNNMCSDISSAYPVSPTVVIVAAESMLSCSHSWLIQSKLVIWMVRSAGFLKFQFDSFSSTFLIYGQFDSQSTVHNPQYRRDYR